MDKKSTIYIAGHKGMVGSAILRCLKENGYTNLVIASSKELDLRNQKEVNNFFTKERPDFVILAAAKVGGIRANIKYPGDFIYDNLAIQNNVINASKLFDVKKFVFLGSSCIYPKECPQPMKEEYLLSGPLEPTNEGYALAKIAGITMLNSYKKQHGLNSISIIPPNLYGPNDSFDLDHCHVLSALVKRFSDAVSNNDNEITLWGTGIARREFMHVDDLAKAVFYFLENKVEQELINIGWGKDISIKELAEIIAKKTGFNGKIQWDSSKPNGMLKKCMNIDRMNELDITPNIKLNDGINEMIKIYKTL
tara:strand:+ start:13910 stop:14833 length:924 start_codon:yes stop_codon:yes gene_type:complete